MIKGLKKLQRREEKKERAGLNQEIKSKEHSSTSESSSSEDVSEKRVKSRKHNKEETRTKPQNNTNEETEPRERRKEKGKKSGKRTIWRAKKAKQHSSWEDVSLPEVQYDQPRKQSKLSTSEETSSSEEAAETASSEESTIEKMVREENEKPTNGRDRKMRSQLKAGEGVKLVKGKKLSHKQLKMLVQAAAEKKRKSNNPLCRDPSSMDRSSLSLKFSIKKKREMLYRIDDIPFKDCSANTMKKEPCRMKQPNPNKKVREWNNFEKSL